MGSSVRILVLLSFCAITQGNVIEEAIEYTRKLAEEVNTGLKQILSAANESKETILMQHDKYRKQAIDGALEYVQKAKTKVQEAKCKNLESALTQLDELPAKVGDRWDTCVNFTTEFEKLGYYIKGITNDLENSELVICDAIQNVSRCDGNFIQKWACVSAGLGSYSYDIAEQGGHIWNYLSEINSYLERIIVLLIGCITNTHVELKAQTDLVLATECNLTM